VTRILFERRDWNDEWERRAAAGAGDPRGAECVPPLDVTETADAFQITIDLPGVPADAVAVTIREATILVTGDKRPARCQSDAAAFHLAERSFGRFVRVIRVGAALDARRAVVTLDAGELRITVPRLAERRGEEIRLTVSSPPSA
jgi:HSP20 family protein